MMKKMISTIGRLMVAAVILMSSHAFGQTLTSLSETQTFTNVAAGSYTLDFALFNTNLGTLESVTISLGDVFVTGTASVTNNTNTNPVGGTAPGTYTYYVNYTGTFDVTDSVGLNTDAGNDVALTVSAPTSHKSLAIGATLTTPTASNTSAGSAETELSTTNGDDLTGYEGNGTGTVALTLATGNSVTATGTSNFSTTSSGTGSGAVTVTYNYLAPSATPEPSTWALMIGAGFGAILFVRRRSAIRA